jgi:hypothetical protein
MLSWVYHYLSYAPFLAPIDILLLQNADDFIMNKCGIKKYKVELNPPYSCQDIPFNKVLTKSPTVPDFEDLFVQYLLLIS